MKINTTLRAITPQAAIKQALRLQEEENRLLRQGHSAETARRLAIQIVIERKTNHASKNQTF